MDFAAWVGGSTALHFAAEMGHGAIIQALCAAGADAASADADGRTPLHVACAGGGAAAGGSAAAVVHVLLKCAPC